jgi:hypothetical protein
VSGGSSITCLAVLTRLGLGIPIRVGDPFAVAASKINVSAENGELSTTEDFNCSQRVTLEEPNVVDAKLRS